MTYLRTKLSRARAQILTLAGVPKGFFTPYPYANGVTPGHAPYPEVEALFARSGFRDFLATMGSFVESYASFGSSPTDPIWERGTMFPPLDGAAAYTAARTFKPRRIIEIGSGDSTFYLARGAKDGGAGTEITCIDPIPRRSISELGVNYAPRLLRVDDADLCSSLDANDILFIDSSHIMLPGMDVDIQFNRIFPRLKPGVIVHIHDIFLPDGYPFDWRGRHYSEQQALIGWLISGYFEVIYPGAYVATRHAAEIDCAFRNWPVVQNKAAGSIWLRKA
jgi:predicted O-methyltransferase YrrM